MNSSRLEQFAKRFRRIIIVLIPLCLAGLTGLFVLLTNDLRHQTAEQKVSKPTIALVNEDEAANFNKQSYTFGKNFVNLVSNDDKYNWQVLSRSVANKAYSDKSVDAVIYIPQNFSQNIVTLQDTDPIKAEVDYKVLPKDNTLSEHLLQDKISNILNTFNRNIVKLYYASVAGSVASAVSNMNNSVNNQTSLLGKVKGGIYPQLSEVGQNYSSVISTAHNLNRENNSWIEQQNSFTNETKNTLTSIANSFNAQLPNLTNYFDVEALIVQSNLSNANQAISNQEATDKGYFTDLQTLTRGQLNGLVASDSPGISNNYLTQLNELFVNYETAYNNIYGDSTGAYLGEQERTLTAEQNGLFTLENKIIQIYLPSLTVDENTDQSGLLSTQISPDQTLSDALTENERETLTGLIACLGDNGIALQDNSNIKMELDKLPKPEVLNSLLTNFKNWITPAVQAIDNASWTAAPNTLSLFPWSGKETALGRLYTNTEAGNSLSQNFNQLITQSNQEARNIAQSAQEIRNNSSDFDLLVSTTSTAETTSKKLLTDTNAMMQVGNSDLISSNQYAVNFSGTLANTRTPGANMESIYDFFADPLTPKNVTSQAKTTIGKKFFDWRWAVVFIGGILLGTLGMLLQRGHVNKNQN